MAQGGGVRRGVGGLRARLSSFRDGPKDQTPDVQLHIRESRGSGFDAEPVIGPRFARTRWHRPGMTRWVRALPDAHRHCKGCRHRCLPRSGSPAGPVAQWLEPAAHNGLVPGSSPGRPTSLSLAKRVKAAAPKPNGRRRALRGCSRLPSASVARGMLGMPTSNHEETDVIAAIADPPPVQDARARYTRGAKRDHVPNLVPAGGARPHSSGGQPDRSARRKDDFTIRRWKGAIPAI
jgi:hypothetical protein